MKTLYQKAYKRLLGKLLGSQEAVKGEVPATLSNYSHDILHRLPREDFKLSLKTPCFVNEYSCCHAVPRLRSMLSKASRESESMRIFKRAKYASSVSTV